MTLSAPARGQILVNECCKILWIGSDGRLCPYEPIADVEMHDLLVKVAGEPAVVGLQPKGDFKLDRMGQVRATVETSTFTPSRFSYIVVMDFRKELLGLGPYIWILRADEFARVVPLTKWGYRFSASPRPKPKKDKYHKWRFQPLELAAVVETALEQIRVEGLRRPLPSARADVIAARRSLGLPASIR